MLFSISLLLAAAAGSIAVPLSDRQFHLSGPWQISDFTTRIPEHNPKKISSTSFSFYDPKTNMSTTCQSKSAPGLGENVMMVQNYVACKNASASFMFNGYQLGMTYGYLDPSVGMPDYVTEGGSGNVTLTCHKKSGSKVCKSKAMLDITPNWATA